MIDRFSLVFKEIEQEIGTRDLNILVLKALHKAFQNYTGKTVESLCHQLEEVVHIINNTDPRFAIVIYNFYNLYERVRNFLEQSKKNHKPDFFSYKEEILAIIDQLITEAENQKTQLLQHAEKIDINGKAILIHDHSHTVQDVLWHLKQKGQKFVVIVAEQDMEKTLSIIEILTERGIEFRVVPAHMLSNIENDIDICFFGALTLKSTFDFVVDTGTNAIVSEFHLQKKPVYMFLSTSKFSLWESHKKETINKSEQKRKHPFKDIYFERFKFSHDRVPLSTVDFTVTDEGIFGMEDLKKLYQKKFKEQAAHMKKFGAI